jgi:hypothetical protein
MKFQIRSDLYSGSSVNINNVTQMKNIQEDAKIFIIPDKKMVTLSMKRKRTEENNSSSWGKKLSGREKKDFTNMSATDILQEIDRIIKAY